MHSITIERVIEHNLVLVDCFAATLLIIPCQGRVWICQKYCRLTTYSIRFARHSLMPAIGLCSYPFEPARWETTPCTVGLPLGLIFVSNSRPGDSRWVRTTCARAGQRRQRVKGAIETRNAEKACSVYGERCVEALKSIDVMLWGRGEHDRLHRTINSRGAVTRAKPYNTQVHNNLPLLQLVVKTVARATSNILILYCTPARSYYRQARRLSRRVCSRHAVAVELCTDET